MHATETYFLAEQAANFVERSLKNMSAVRRVECTPVCNLHYRCPTRYRTDYEASVTLRASLLNRVTIATIVVGFCEANISPVFLPPSVVDTSDAGADLSSGSWGRRCGRSYNDTVGRYANCQQTWFSSPFFNALQSICGFFHFL